MPRLAIVSVHYYRHWLEKSLHELSRIVALTGADHCILVNNNPAIQADVLRLAESHAFVKTALLHDNSGHEFGAYQLGLDKTLEAGDFDWVLFVNDTFSTHQPFFRSHRVTIASCLGRPADNELAMIVGKVDALDRSYVLNGVRSHRWVATNIFALNRKAVRALNGRVHYPVLDDLVRPSGDVEQFFSEGFDETLLKHLAAWLFTGRAGSRWHSAAPLNADNAPRFVAKARAILQEKYLSALLEENCAYFLDLRKMGYLERVVCRAESLVFDLEKLIRHRQAGAFHKQWKRPATRHTRTP